jgi:predicted Zn-dependent protease
MKHVSVLALALLTGCAAARPAGEVPPSQVSIQRPGAGPSAGVAEASRAMSVIDDAERKGDIAAERARWFGAATDAPDDVRARFLAIYALPHTEETWGEFRWLAKEKPDSAYGWVGMARIYVEWGLLDQVEKALAGAVDADDGNWLATLVRAQAEARGGKGAAAEASFRAVLGRDPGNVEAHVGLARLAAAAGDAVVARAEAEAALLALPEHAPALAILADLAAQAGDRAGAATLLYRVVAASPRDRAARVALARLLKEKGDPAAARDQWKAALALREDADGLVSLAEVSRLGGDVAAEQKALERLSQIDPGSAEWRRIAEIRLAANDLDGAEKALRRTLARDARDPASNLALGRILVKTGRLQEALEALRAAGAPGAADRAELEQRLNVQRTPKADVAGLQRSVGALIDKTYRQRLKESPRLSGRLTVRATVDASGTAALIEVLEDSVHDEDVRACAYWNLRDATYPSEKPGRYSFTFALTPGR